MSTKCPTCGFVSKRTNSHDCFKQLKIANQAMAERDKQTSRQVKNL